MVTNLLSNFWWLKSANNVKFTEKCVMFIEKHVQFLKFSKEKVKGTMVNKENHADFVLGHKRTHHN